MKVWTRRQDKRVEWEDISTHPDRSPLPPGRHHIIFEITDRENRGSAGNSDGGPTCGSRLRTPSGIGQRLLRICNFAAWGEHC